MHPFAGNEGLLISVSQLKAYLRCPRAFELKYVRGAPPEFTPVAFAFGKALHAGLAGYYGGIKLFGAVPSLEEIAQTFRDAWQQAITGPVPLQKSPDPDDDEVDHVEKGVQMLGVFHSHAASAGLVQVEAVEKTFVVSLFDPDTGEVLDEQLSGVIDLVLREEERNVLVEHKSSARRYSADQLRFDAQLTAYQLAAREIGLGEPMLRFQVLTKTKTPALQVEDVRRDEFDEHDFLRTALGVLRAVDAGVSYPVRSFACRTCPFQTACSRRSGHSPMQPQGPALAMTG